MANKPNRLQVMATDLKKIREALESLKETGLNMKLMVMYLAEETGLSERTINSVLAAQARFLDEAFEEGSVNQGEE